ncbi:MAG: hypothetical protein U0W24_08925 [Bacteroidales bacterium]
MGLGNYHENYTETNFFTVHFGANYYFNQKREYLLLDARFTIDENNPDIEDDNAYPFSEVSLNYHRRFLNAKNLNGYFSFGGFYHNYYHTSDIWAFQAGIVLNWHN